MGTKPSGSTSAGDKWETICDLEGCNSYLSHSSRDLPVHTKGTWVTIRRRGAQQGGVFCSKAHAEAFLQQNGESLAGLHEGIDWF